MYRLFSLMAKFTFPFSVLSQELYTPALISPFNIDGGKIVCAHTQNILYFYFCLLVLLVCLYVLCCPDGPITHGFEFWILIFLKKIIDWWHIQCTCIYIYNVCVYIIIIYNVHVYTLDTFVYIHMYIHVRTCTYTHVYLWQQALLDIVKSTLRVVCSYSRFP